MSGDASVGTSTQQRPDTRSPKCQIQEGNNYFWPIYTFWAGAVVQKLPVDVERELTDGPTNRQSDRLSYRVAWHAAKKKSAL